MYITAILVLLLLLSLVTGNVTKTNGLREFNLNNTAPLRGLLALLIVCHHLSYWPGGHIPYTGTFFETLGSPIVAVFFMLSGYGLFISYKTKGERYLNGFLGKRYSKILPTFIILSLLAVGIWYLYGKSLSEQTAKFVRGDTPLPYSWFIYAIIYVYAAFYCAASLGKRLITTGVLFTVFIVAYTGIMMFVLRFSSWWYLTILCTSAGYFIGLFECKIERMVSNRRARLYGAAICAILLLFYASTVVDRLAGALTILWLITVAFSVYLIIRGLGMKRWTWLVFIGEISMEIYLIHGLVILCLAKQFDSLQGLALYAATFSITILLAWGIHRLSSGKGRGR